MAKYIVLLFTVPGTYQNNPYICVLPEVAELEKQFRLVDQDVVGLDIGVDNVGLLHYLQG